MKPTIYSRFFTPTLTHKLALWIALCAATSAIFFREFWTNITFILSWDYAQAYGVFPWVVLALCALMIWAKRRTILEKLQTSRLSPPFILAGLSLFALAVVPPTSEQYIVLQLLLAFLGIFTILFGEATFIPTILLAIYGLTSILPVAVSRFAGYHYALATTVPLVAILKLFGFPITNQGVAIHLTNPSGQDTYATVDASCAGGESMAVFLAIFALMTLDVMLPTKKAIYMFLFGIIGTYLQNLLRAIILILVGYYSGQSAMSTAHNWVIYLIFPIWFAIFAYVYLRQARSAPKASGQDLKAPNEQS